MNAEEDAIRTVINAGLRVTRIVWAAFLINPVILGIILVFVQPEGSDDALTILPLVLCMMSLVQIPVMLFMRMRLMGGVGLVAPDDFRTTDTEPVTKLQAQFADNRYRTGTLVSLAFAESIVLFGFVSSFVTGSLIWYPILGAMGGLLMAVLFPQKAGLLIQFEGPQRKTLTRIMGW